MDGYEPVTYLGPGITPVEQDAIDTARNRGADEFLIVDNDLARRVSFERKLRKS